MAQEYTGEVIPTAKEYSGPVIPVSDSKGSLADQIPGGRRVIEPEKPTSLLEKAVGKVEADISFASNIPAALYGGASYLLGGAAGAAGLAEKPKGTGQEQLAENIGKFVYQPRTEEGKKRLSSYGEMLESAKIPPWPVTTASTIPGFGTGVGAVARGARNIVGDVAGYEGINAYPAGAVKPSTGIRPEVISKAIKEGWKIPPSQAGAGVLGKSAEGLSGKIQTAQRASTFNADNANKLAREDLGISPDERITEEGLRAIRAKEGEAYQAIKELDSPILPTKEYLKRVSELGGDFKAAAKEFPEILKNDQVETLIRSLSAPQQISGRAAIEVVKKLRSDATSNLRAFDDPQKAALGRAQRNAANAIDDLIEQHLEKTGNKAASERYRQAREKIAKTHDVEAALNDATGNISPRVLGRLDEKGKPLSGGLKKIAEFYRAFPKAAQDIEKIGSQPGLSPLDYATGAISAAAAGKPGLLAMIAGRPAIREALLSDTYQNVLGRRADRRMADMVKSTAESAPAPLPEVPGAVPVVPGTNLNTLLSSAQEPNVPLPQLPERLQSGLERQIGAPGSSIELGERQGKTPLPTIPKQETGLLSTGDSPAEPKLSPAMKSVEMKLRPEVIDQVRTLREAYGKDDAPFAEKIRAASQMAALENTYPGFVADMEKADSTFKFLYEKGKGTALPIEKAGRAGPSTTPPNRPPGPALVPPAAPTPAPAPRFTEMPPRSFPPVPGAQPLLPGSNLKTLLQSTAEPKTPLPTLPENPAQIVTSLKEMLGGPQPAQKSMLPVRGAVSDEMTKSIIAMKGAIGADEVGGRMILDETTRNTTPGFGEVIGRTSWTGDPWWFNRVDKLSAAEARNAIDKFAAGEKLGKRQQGFIDYTRYYIEDQQENGKVQGALGLTDDEMADSIKFDTEAPPTKVDVWQDLTEEQKQNELDQIFGPNSRRKPKSEGGG